MPPRAKPVPPGKIRRVVRTLTRIAALWPLLLIAAPAPANADGWTELVERLTADGFERPAVEALFNRSEVLFEPDAMAGKLKALVRSRSAYPDSPSASLRTAVRRGYLQNGIISRARSYLHDNRAVLNEVSAHYGVPREIVVSILLIETHLGRNTGSSRVFNRLASMARCSDLESIRPYLSPALITAENEEYARRRCREKADWAYEELKALLRYAERDGADPLGIRGSIYGAIGMCQFMPTNVFSFGVDADGDGRIDPFAKPDALHSIANYLRGHGWRQGLDRRGQHRVIFGYNHSTVYANTVLAVADRIRSRTSTRP